ncbi:MAG: phage Gp37/Gp68 family protein [Caldilineaceae bacterium]|nr:phage Gp37/Gp68 family protein [Caldilineaceae bacterium]
MGENSKIEWCDHTFNPWIGCVKVSPGCQHCYAEAFARRYNKAEWGPTAPRVRTSDANWHKPVAWNRKAKREGRRYRVFCASLADVFEDHAQVNRWRISLLELIEATDGLDWLLLTKRPENVKPLIEQTAGRSAENFFERNPHVWIGASMEDEQQADKRARALLEIPARVRFASLEPLLGPVNLLPYVIPRFNQDSPLYEPWRNGIEWVIVGGESGPHARPMRPEWVRDLRDQCVRFGVAFLFKQWGEWGPTDSGMIKQGKTTAGRVLDGRTWDERPEEVAA